MSTSQQRMDEQEVQRLQQVIHDHRSALDAAAAGTPAYQPAVTAVLEATVQLVNYEVGIEVQGREAYSARTATIVRWVGLVTAAIIAVVAVLTVTSWLSKWWLVLLVPLLALAIRIAVAAAAAAPSDRPARRTAAIIWALTVGADLVLILYLHWLPHWIIGMLMFITTLGCLIAAGQLLSGTSATKSNETGD